MKIENFKDILYEKDEDGIVMLTLNTPKRKNAMSFYTFHELHEAVDVFEKDDFAHVMILTGAKDPDNNNPAAEAFSSGGYFNPSALQGIAPEIMQKIDLSDIAQKKLTMKFFECDKPVIAAINGLSIGGGFTMPLACADLIYASEYAWMRMPFVRLGIVPEFGSAYLLPRLIGYQRAKEIMYFGEKFTAEKALEMGLINKILPHDDLIPYAKEMALKLIPPGGPGFAVRLTKRALHQPYIDAMSKSLDIENAGLNQSITTKDFAEAAIARKEKRDPVYTGK